MRVSIKILSILILLITLSSCNFSNLKKTDSTVLKTLEKKISKEFINEWAIENGFRLIKSNNTTKILSKEGEFLGSILEHKSKRVVTTFPLLGRKLVNPLLDKKLFANTKYKVGSTIFETDIQARVIKAEISSIPKNIINRKSIKGANENAKAMLKDGYKGIDHGGHIIAHSLGGNSGAINIVAQYGKLNQGHYSSIERFIRKNKRNIKNYNVNLTYKDKSLRPLNFVQTFDYVGSLRNLKKMAKRHPYFKYAKENSSTYRCVILHSNKV